MFDLKSDHKKRNISHEDVRKFMIHCWISS